MLGPNPRQEAEEATKRAQEARIENLQQAHLDELRALRATISGAPGAAPIEEAEYFLRQDGKIRGPFAKGLLLDLFAAKKIEPDTEIAPASQPDAFRPLSAEIPLARS